MSRTAAPEVIYTKPKNNVYTVLLAVALIVEIVGFVAVFKKHKELFGLPLFSDKTGPSIAR